jgi:hypothetical protein
MKSQDNVWLGLCGFLGFILRGQHSTHSFETAVQVVPGISERLAEFPRNFVHREPSKEIRRHRRSLLVVQLLQTLLNEASSLFQGQTGSERYIPRENFRLKLVDLYACVISAAFQMTPLVYRARVGVPKKQGPEGAAIFVIPQHRGVDFEEEALYQVLGFRLVPQYRVRQAKYILPIPVKEHEKRDVTAPGHFPAQFFVTERAKLDRSVKAFPEDHLSLSRAGSANALLLNDGMVSATDTCPARTFYNQVRDNIHLISMR